MIKGYTYLIGWTEHQKFYYGVRYAEGCDPSELWVSYFTSSKAVSKFVEEFGNPDIIETRQIFSSKDKAIEWECKVLRRMKVIHRDDFLNRTDNRAFRHTPGNFHPWFGRSHTKETKRKISSSLSGQNNPRFGTHWSDSIKTKISQSLKGKEKTAVTREKMSQAAKLRVGKLHNRVKSVSMNGKIFNTRKEAAEFHNVSPSLITKWAKSEIRPDIYYV